MILGTGVDIVDVRDLAAQLRTPGSHWLDLVLTTRERRRVRDRLAASGTTDEDVDALALHVGARWAAKEAVVKAWSAALVGMAPPIPEEELDLREIEIVHDHWGRPAVELRGRVARAVEESLAGRRNPPGTSTRTPGGRADTRWAWHVSLSHDGHAAIAMVILEGPSA